MPRPYRRRPDWLTLIQEHRRSGLSVSAFCAERGLAPSSFHRWRRRAEPPADRAAPAFVELVRADAATPAAAPIRVDLPSGAVVRCDTAADPRWVAALLVACARRPC
jgi:transposase-like protein